MEEDIILKILILGDSAVGKTCLLLKYIDGFFPEEYISTIGVDYKNKKIQINDMDIHLQIWDTCGQERYRSLSKSFIKGANGVLFVYDITSKDSFKNIKNWILETNNENEDYKILIAGNKADLNDMREVTEENVKSYLTGKNQDIPTIEVSAKDGTNVDEAFTTLAKLIIGNKTKEEVINTFKRKDNKNKKKNRDNKNCMNC
jgi:Ras-related protein Rab-1A